MKEVIVLAGGKGSRLQAVVSDVPKPMAPIHNKPFLHALLQQLHNNGCDRVILSVGYKWETIKDFFGDHYLQMDIIYSIENEPLGTGGAIKKALTQIQSNWCHVVNGDTYFDVELDWSSPQEDETYLYAKSLNDTSRYGALLIEKNEIIGFSEKGKSGEGYINGGIYKLSKEALNTYPGGKFSFEETFMIDAVNNDKLMAIKSEAYFIDIGIPEDYQQFINDQEVKLKELNINKDWTLFLDRDGVINDRLIDDYVKQLNELTILNGVPEAVAEFNKIFKRIVVVTNQQGIGKGSMDENDLEIIHGYMNNIFENANGKIEKFYFAPQLVAENSNYRKPGTGMGLHAKRDFDDIDFNKCLMVGDSESDIEFGMKLGMKTIMLTTIGNVSTKADYIFDNLHTLAKELKT
ncbi:MAG: D-glycero-alpha-D-manno-heptose 1-phosphate guanylyltransferase [Arenicella sp.]|jgi:D-glycero-alpha-D-manno-heptose 1-phosphate guanylyltransferase